MIDVINSQKQRDAFNSDVMSGGLPKSTTVWLRNPGMDFSISVRFTKPFLLV